jgi:type II secretory pathway component PulC
MKPAAGVALVLVLFGATGSAQQPSAPLPLSTLPLRLLGVVRDTTTPARSAGLIQCGAPQEKRAAWLFAIGDRACDVAEVTEVLEDAVVIRNLQTSRLELLTLPKAGARTVPPPVETPIEAQPDVSPRPLVHTVSPDVVMVELQRELLHRYLSNIPEVLTSAVATPRYATGGSGPAAIEGYQMSRIKPGGIVEQLGIRDDDVLLEFNGQKLDSLAAVAGLLGQSQELDGSKLTVLRNGKRMTFIYTVK